MRFPRLVLIFLALSWVFAVLYPDPAVLVRSIRNTVHPNIDPAAVQAIARRLPSDPRAIEAYVLGRQVPYAYDWQSAGVPWYFPTTREALRMHSGDCESRAVVLASILTAKGIPNHLYMSLDHIWVDYPGKTANSLENPGVQLAGSRNGHWFFHWPAVVSLRQEWADQVAMYWTPAPPLRVVLLGLGLLLISLWNVLARLAAGGGLRRRAPAGAPLAPDALGEKSAAKERRRLRRGARRAGFAAHPQRV
jgi:hypothetical protein